MSKKKELTLDYPLRLVKHEDGTLEWRDDPIPKPTCKSCDQLKSTLAHYESALKEAKCFLDRLGSMEAFCAPRAVHSSNDEELLARIDYAREKSESLNKVLGEKV